MMTTKGKMRSEVQGAVGVMIFDNPARHNAVSLGMWEAVPAILDGFAADDAIRVVVVRGAGGKAFVSGADISEFESARSGVAAQAHYERTSAAAMEAFARLRKPLVASIDGYCIGGGLAVALACDLRIASASSRFGIPAARLGLGYGFAGVKKLVDTVGPAYAREILFTARRYDADAAWRMGLVNQVVPAAEFEATIAGLVGTMAQNAPLTIQAAKEAVDQVLRPESERDLGHVQALVERCFASEDYTEGRTAFMQKRRPLFRGR